MEKIDSEKSLLDRAKELNNRLPMDKITRSFISDALYRDDCYGEKEMLVVDDKADHKTQYYRVAVRGMLGEFPDSPSYEDYERVVYYGLSKEIRRPLAVGEMEILGDKYFEQRENITHLFVNYFFPTYRKTCPALSKSHVCTEIIYDDETNEVEFSAKLFRENDSDPYKEFHDLLSAMLWCLDRENWPELEK